MRTHALGLTLAFACAPGMAFAQSAPNPLGNAYFGETHIHTAFSLDAFIGGARLMPADAYRFAKGEAVLVNGRLKRLERPLDFAAVTDHAEFLGEMYSTIYPSAPGHLDPQLEQLRTLETAEEKRAWFVENVVSNMRGDQPQHTAFFQGDETIVSGWQVTVDAANAHDEPGVFTALIGFEWSAAPDGANLHRNVLFRDGTVPLAPFSAVDSNHEEDLWTWMAAQTEAGSTLLAIPHNSNASKGQMFPETDSFGAPINGDYAQRRAAFEPLIEMMQIKGNSEVHRSFWAADEFADFENADSIQNNSGRTFSARDFVREGLKLGLKSEADFGTNAFKYGFIGGTDNHNGLMADVAENDFIGGHGPEDGSVDRRRTGDVSGWIDGKDLSIGSLAGVWAPENTRAAIWDAMQRRETFATSGPRIKLRMFGGAAIPPDPTDAVAMAEDGYVLGVPMGATLPADTKPPTFIVYAERDPVGASLDRVQIVKGWIASDGSLNERIVDVVWSGERDMDAAGKVPPVPNTVDVASARYTNEIGAPTLLGSWTDDAFDPAERAFYYARALEIPTPRWSTYDAVRNGLPLLEGVPAIIQERAWGSPIWYSPAD